MRSSITYLGHQLSADGLQARPGKVEAIAQFPTPRNVPELRRFLGMAGYLRRFVLDYGKIVAPLYENFKKDAPWRWELRQQLAFKVVKMQLSGRRCLAHFKPGLPTFVFTDASYAGMGAVLLQTEKDERGRSSPHLVACWSRALTTAESKMHSNQLEAIALRESLCKRFDVYPRGHEPKPIVYTDNNPLAYSMNKIRPNRAFESAIMDIQEILPFFDICHVKGAANRMADALSRAPHERAPAHDDVSIHDIGAMVDGLQQAKSLLVTSKDDNVMPSAHDVLHIHRVNDSLHEEQRKDPFCSRIFNAFHQMSD